MNKRRGFAAPASRPRIVVLAAFLLLLFAAAVGRAVQLQVVDAPNLREYAQDQYERKIKILPARGEILDRNGERLASSIPGSSAFVTGSKVLEDKAAFRRLCKALSLDPRKTEEKIAGRGSNFTTIKRRLTPSEEATVKAIDSPWAGVLPEPMRFYPKKSLAGALLGFTGTDGQGLEGLENRYEDLLGAEPVIIEAERDARAQALMARAPSAATARGKSLRLTLDVWVQHAVEEELEKAVEKYGAKGGIAVAMDPSTGAVMALAQAPPFNPNDPATARPENRKNRAVVDVYEPGSTFKALFMGLLLDLKKTSPGETVYCEQGSWTVAGRTIHDHEREGTLTVPEGLKVSSNIGVAKLSQRLSDAEFYEGLRRYGIGQTTGVDLPGESRGLLPAPERWSKITPMTISYGQGVSVTALQLTAAIAAIANGGMRMKPYVVEAVLDENGREIQRTEPAQMGRAISAAAASTLREWMIGVVHDKKGTGTGASACGYTVAGKTGTAWKVNPLTGGYDTRRIWASFVGFAPAHAPRIALLVAVDEPSKGSLYGGTVAAPAFAEICRRVLPYLGVAPDRDPVAEDEPKPVRAPVAKKAPAKGKKSEVEGAPEPMAAGLMPDLQGVTMREALLRLERTGVGVSARLEGSGFAAEQVPPPGTPLAAGTVCRVFFSPAQQLARGESADSGNGTERRL
jgi:cell division protein FtsI (penicillin-binding protein 3)